MAADLSGDGVSPDAGRVPGEFTNMHPALAEFWHPVALSAEVQEDPVEFRRVLAAAVADA